MNNRAYSLVSVLVAIAVGAGLMFVFTDVGRMASRLSGRGFASSDLDSALLEIANVLRSPSQCRCNLAPGPVFPTVTAASLSTAVFPLAELRLFGSGACTAPRPSPIAAGKKYGQLEVTSLSFRPLTRLSATQALGGLQVDFTFPSGTGGVGRYTRQVPLRFNLSAAGASVQLRGCSAVAASTASGHLSCNAETFTSSGGGAAQKVHCSSPSAKITSASTVLTPIHNRVCPSPLGKEADGTPYAVDGGACAAVSGGNVWSTFVTCCETL